MATFLFVNKGTKAVGDPVSSLTASYTLAVANNFLVGISAVSRFSTTAAALALPTGWTQGELPVSVGNQGSFSTNVGIVLKAGIASGSHSCAWTGFGGSSSAEAIIAEFSGLDTVTPLDVHNHNASGTAGTSGTTGSSGAASQSDVLWIAVGHAENGSNTSAFTSSIAGWTTLANDTSNAAGVAWWCGYQIAAVSTAVNPPFGWTTASIWAGAVCGFILTGGGATGQPTASRFAVTEFGHAGVYASYKEIGREGVRMSADELAYRREERRKRQDFTERVRRAA